MLPIHPCTIRKSGNPVVRKSLIALACTVLCVCGSVVSAASPDEVPLPVGVDVIRLGKEVYKKVNPKPSPVPGRPWSDDLAALTDADPAVANPAIGRLVRRGGPEVLEDLGVLAKDREPIVRCRVVRVAAMIGGTAAAPLVIRLSHDLDPRVRVLATHGLGNCRGDTVLPRLLELLSSPSPDERKGAADSLAALGDTRALRALCRLRRDFDTLAQDAQAAALRGLLRQPGSAGETATLLGTLSGDERLTLLECLDGILDTRLCPALTALLADREALVVVLATRALASAGDARAVDALVRLATSQRMPDVRDAAATTLKSLTGYRAGAGPTWTLWWQDHAALYAELSRRDTLFAELMNSEAAIPAGLAALAPDQLEPLLDAVVGTGRPVPAWFPARALTALRLHPGADWIQPLAQRIDNARDIELRLNLMLLLDEIGGPTAGGELQRQLEALTKREEAALELWKEKGIIPPDMSAEHALINHALALRAH